MAASRSWRAQPLPHTAGIWQPLTSLNCTICGCTRSRWLMISRSTYLVTCARDEAGGGERIRKVTPGALVGGGGDAHTRRLRNAVAPRILRCPWHPCSKPSAHLVPPLDELDGNQLSCALVPRQLHKPEGPTVQVSYLGVRRGIERCLQGPDEPQTRTNSPMGLERPGTTPDRRGAFPPAPLSPPSRSAGAPQGALAYPVALWGCCLWSPLCVVCLGLCRAQTANRAASLAEKVRQKMWLCVCVVTMKLWPPNEARG
jgi:hypothetical protein